MRTKYSEDFEMFWAVYPKKDAKLRAVAWFEKNKPSKEDVERMLYTISFQSKQFGGRLNCERQYMPLPCTWLNDGDWMDGLTKAEIDEQNAIKKRKWAETKATALACDKARREENEKAHEERRKEIRTTDGAKFREMTKEKLQEILDRKIGNLWMTRGWLIKEIIAEKEAGLVKEK